MFSIYPIVVYPKIGYTNYRDISLNSKKSGEARKAKGQKGKGCGERNFCPFAIRIRAFSLFSD